MPVDFQPWMKYANCTGQTHLFFSHGPNVNYVRTRGRILCLTCTVRTSCLSYAIDHKITEGMWGGTTQWERRVMLGLPRDSVTKPRPSGVDPTHLTATA